MRVRIASLTILISTGVLIAGPLALQDKGGQEEYGPCELVDNWPQPLPDGADGVKHAGWTWGSVGAVYAETPDRIWIAQRGELPLPDGAKPWTPHSLLQPPQAPPPATPTASARPASRRRSAAGSAAGITPCSSSIATARSCRTGRIIEKMFSRGSVRARPAQDQDEPVRSRQARLDHRRPAARDLEVHLRRQAGDDARHDRRSVGATAGKLFDRPTDIAWLPGRHASSSATATAACASRSSTRTASS